MQEKRSEVECLALQSANAIILLTFCDHLSLASVLLRDQIVLISL